MNLEGTTFVSNAARESNISLLSRLIARRAMSVDPI